MHLTTYVDRAQLAALGHPSLGVGGELEVALVGYRGWTIDAPARPLDCYMSRRGSKQLVRTGLAEYAFSGEILEARKRRWKGDIEYGEALIDCGVQLIFAEYRGRATIGPLDLDDPANRELTPGKYLSGMMLLSAHVVWSFRDPPLIDYQVKGRVVSMHAIDLNPSAERVGALREIAMIDPYRSVLPILATVEIDAA